MCEKAILQEPQMLKYCPDLYKTQEVRERAVLKKPQSSEFVPDQHKTQERATRLQIKIFIIWKSLVTRKYSDTVEFNQEVFT